MYVARSVPSLTPLSYTELRSGMYAALADERGRTAISPAAMSQAQPVRSGADLWRGLHGSEAKSCPSCQPCGVVHSGARLEHRARAPSRGWLREATAAAAGKCTSGNQGQRGMTCAQVPRRTSGTQTPEAHELRPGSGGGTSSAGAARHGRSPATPYRSLRLTSAARRSLASTREPSFRRSTSTPSSPP